MPNYAIVENNLVVNAVVAEPDYALEQGWILLPENAGIGWSYENGNFVDHRPVPEEPPAPAVTPTPTKEDLLAQLLALQKQIEELK
jgi:hypothetical protein